MEEQKRFPIMFRQGTIHTEGRMSYNEGAQAWNTIRLKKEFLTQLPKLKDKKACVRYRMECNFTYEDLVKILKGMKEKGEPLPILLFLEESPHNY